MRYKKFNIIIFLLLVNKFVFSQFYFEPNINYNKTYNAKNNSKFHTSSFLYIVNSDTIRDIKDTVLLNLSENFSYGINFGYKVNKKLSLNASYDISTSNLNPKFITDKYTYKDVNYVFENTLFEYYKETVTHNTSKFYLNNLQTFKIGVTYNIPFEKINIFGDFNLTYSKIKISKNVISTTEFYHKFDTLVLFNVDTSDFSDCELISKQKDDITEEFHYNNNINYNINIGVELKLSEKLSGIFKVGYKTNNFDAIYKDVYYNDISKQKLYTHENFFFNTINFNLSLRYYLVAPY